jgi:hypothetical protein
LTPTRKFFYDEWLLSVGKLDCKDLTTPFLIDPERDEHGVRASDACLVDLLVLRIDDEKDELFVQPPLGKGRQALVQLLVDRGYRQG